VYSMVFCPFSANRLVAREHEREATR